MHIATVAEVQQGRDRWGARGVWYPILVLDEPARGWGYLEAGGQCVAVGDIVAVREAGPFGSLLCTVVTSHTDQPWLRSCPSCGAATRPHLAARRGGTRYCPNELSCEEQITGRLIKMSAPDALHLPLRAPHQIRALLNSSALVDERGLFELNRQVLDLVAHRADLHSHLERRALAPDAAGALVRALAEARELPAARVLHALNPVPAFERPLGYGTLQWTLLRHFGSIQALFDVSWQELYDVLRTLVDDRFMKGSTPTRFETVARGMAAWFAVPWHREIIHRWDAAGVRMNLPKIRQTLVDASVTFVDPSTPVQRSSGTTEWLRAEDEILSRGGTVRIYGPQGDFVYVPDNQEIGVVKGRGGLRTVLTSSEFRQLLYGGPAAVPPSVPAADNLWSEILEAHPARVKIGSRGRLPMNPSTLQPGALYMYTRSTGQIAVIVANSLNDAVVALESDPESVFVRTRALWVPGSPEGLRESSPVLRRPRSALQTGRPRVIRRDEDWLAVAHVAGIYRIYLVDEVGPCIYVGRSQDLRVRPRRHEKTAGLPWSDGTTPGVTRVELLAVKSTAGFHTWTITDLDDAEETHIARARMRFDSGRSTSRVLNVTGGRNGPPSRPRTQMFVWKAE